MTTESLTVALPLHSFRNLRPYSRIDSGLPNYSRREPEPPAGPGTDGATSALRGDGRYMSYGLMSFGVALGAAVPVEEVIGEYTEDRERILGYGVRTIHRAAPGGGV